MTIKEFRAALKSLGYDVEYGVNSYYVVRGNDTFAKISRRYERTIDTYPRLFSAATTTNAWLISKSVTLSSPTGYEIMPNNKSWAFL